MNVTTALEGKIVLFTASAKTRSARGASHHPASMGNCPTISHTFLALSTQLVSSSSLHGSKNVGSVQNFMLLVCAWCESRELGSKGSSRFACITPVVETFSDRVTFRIPSNISDGAPLQKQPTALTLISRC